MRLLIIAGLFISVIVLIVAIMILVLSYLFIWINKRQITGEIEEDDSDNDLI